jgi:hypothetical protein
MEIAETERLMLIKKKEEICGLTLKILDMVHSPENLLEIKKNFTSIISLLSQIASYSKSKSYNLDKFTDAVNMLFLTMEQEKDCDIWIASPIAIGITCNYANSVRFDFTKKGLKITFPKNINIGHIINK